MLLSFSTWPEVEARLERSRTIVVPVGSTEQHGPTGLLGTDALCPEIIAREAHEAGDLLVAPTFAVGMAQHHLGFPGTISLRPSTMIAAVRDWCESLHGHGFDRIYWLNGHGGNAATLEAAFSEVYAEASFGRRRGGLALRLRNWWELKGVFKLCTRLFPAGHGGHATPSEIAVTQYAFPQAIKRADYAPRIAGSGPIRDAADFRARHADGRMGSDPGLATPEAGGEIVRFSAEALVAEVRAFEREAG
jgi:creatinine amidohydrolase